MHNKVWNSYPDLNQKHICLSVSTYSLTTIWNIYQKESTANLINIICIPHNTQFFLASRVIKHTQSQLVY